MNAIQLLKKDHKTVKELFKKIEKAGDRAYQKKQDLFQEIRRELEVHAQIEEEIFYPAVKQALSKEGKDLVREALEEHKVVKTLLAEISALRAEDETYDAKVTVLQETVEHHVEEEEGDLFKEAKKHLSKERLEEMGAEMEACKETVKVKVASQTAG